jgi:hypothetical protein
MAVEMARPARAFTCDDLEDMPDDVVGPKTRFEPTARFLS